VEYVEADFASSKVKGIYDSAFFNNMRKNPEEVS
jgi:hypothetical protein